MKRKLTLSKETIRRLTTNEMDAVAGGQFDFRKLTDDPQVKYTTVCDPTVACPPTVGCWTEGMDCTGSFDCD